MKLPRTLKIILLIKRTLSAILKNEKFLFKKNLADLDDLGGIYIKFLQIVVLSLDQAGNHPLLKDMLKVYERSQPDSLDVNAYINKVHSGLTPYLASVETKPFATGSFGQVYKGVLQSQQIVIIKILRPSVVKYLSYDLRLLNLLSFIYALIDRQKLIDFRRVYSEFRKSCLEETNYLREAEMAEYYYQEYQDHERLVIPKTYSELSNGRVIVQDYIDGLSLAKLLEIKAGGTDPKDYVMSTLNSDLDYQLSVIGFELLSRALMGDFLQADPHPGNLILLQDNKVALIDFGMTTELSENRGAFYELLLQYRAYYMGQLAIEEFGIAALKFLSPKLYAAITQADKFLAGRDSDGQTLADRVRYATKMLYKDEPNQQLINYFLENRMIMKLLFYIINRENRFGFSFDMKSFNLLKAAQTYLNLVGRFDNATQTIGGVIISVTDFGAQNLDNIARERSLNLKPGESLEILSAWFDKISRNDPWLLYHIAGGYLK